MKCIISMFMLTGLVLAAGNVTGQAPGDCVIRSILSGYSTKVFTADPVSDNDLRQILQCGIKAPSAMNSQLWKFTVLKDASRAEDLIQGITPGNVLIFISGAREYPEGIHMDFDCALATENMFVAARGLGLGARIYTGPVGMIDDDRQKQLNIPEGFRVVSILRIGNVDPAVDAVSAASSRKDWDEIVNYAE